MSGFLMLVVGVLYLATGVSLFFEGKTGLSIAFVAYALANVGLYMEAMK